MGCTVLKVRMLPLVKEQPDAHEARCQVPHCGEVLVASDRGGHPLALLLVEGVVDHGSE